MNASIFYGEGNSNITLTFGPQSDQVDWTAFQGFVYAPGDSGLTSNCLLAGETFDLTDNTTIIPIFAYGNRSTMNVEYCTWTFNVTEGYQLKLVITALDLANSETLNATGTNSTKITEPGSYIFDGEQIELIYYKNHASYASSPTNYGFQGYVTLSNFTDLGNTSCQSNPEDDGSATYTNYDKDKGYPDNAVSNFT